ncbi:MAG TPA: response regulator transcription factor [Rhodothermales bacterium]|nr:response regulator transcription factor [Rhodothermales bacterium]
MPHQIFIVEDHPIMRQAYANVLDREPDLDLCGTSASAEEALETLKEVSCDLVVVDVSLPGMDGLAFTERFLKMKPETLVLIISGHDEAVLGDRARRAGARAYLTKKGLGRMLAGAIRKELHSGLSSSTY